MATIFDAIADPTRRRMLDRLRHDGPLSVTQLARPLEMTRQGATKHLDVLVESGLVRMRRRGRLRLHALEPAALGELWDWLAPYAAEWDRRLDRLRRLVDAQP